MGLDMYLQRYSKFDDETSLQLVDEIERYLDDCFFYDNYPDAKKPGKEPNCSKECLEFYKNQRKMSTRELPFKTVYQDVGYWRKAWPIHNWFVANVQDGEDDCGRYEVPLSALEELLDRCRNVKEIAVLEPRKLLEYTSYSRERGKVDRYYTGSVVLNTDDVESLIPDDDGKYDDSYMSDISRTINILERAIETTDFENETITYCSSW